MVKCTDSGVRLSGFEPQLYPLLQHRSPYSFYLYLLFSLHSLSILKMNLLSTIKWLLLFYFEELLWEKIKNTRHFSSLIIKFLYQTGHAVCLNSFCLQWPKLRNQSSYRSVMFPKRIITSCFLRQHGFLLSGEKKEVPWRNSSMIGNTTPAMWWVGNICVCLCMFTNICEVVSYILISGIKTFRLDQQWYERCNVDYFLYYICILLQCFKHISLTFFYQI